jgi:succinyl-diaminopimelate desuccinylase
VAIYGHLDVRPAGKGWSTAPFAPTRRGDRLFARGASDDKGQLMAHLVALEAWGKVGGPPIDVLLVVDGAEEIGSPGLAQLLKAPSRCRPYLEGVGALVCSDSRMVAPCQPGLTVSLRAMLELEIALTVQRSPVHAGRFGGAVVDPALVLSARLGRAARAVRRLGPSAGAVTPPEFAGRGALSVTSLLADGGPGAIPNAARATVDVRLPPRLDPQAVHRQLSRWLCEPRRPGVRVQVDQRASSAGGLFPLPAPLLAAVHRAVLAGFGRPPRAVASGASVPGVTLLASVLACPSILLGLGPEDDQAHGPNEYLNLQEWPHSVDTAVLLFASIAEALNRRTTSGGAEGAGVA